MHLFKSHAFVLMPSAPRRSSAFPAVCVFYLAVLGDAGSFIAAFGLSGSGLVSGLVAPGPVGSLFSNQGSTLCPLHGKLGS